MLAGNCLHLRNLCNEIIPYILVITDIHIERCLLFLDRRKEIPDDGCEDFLLRSCSTDGEQEAGRLTICLTSHSSVTVCFDVRNQLVIDVVTGVNKRVIRHWLIDLVLLHTI